MRELLSAQNFVVAVTLSLSLVTPVSVFGSAVSNASPGATKETSSQQAATLNTITVIPGSPSLAEGDSLQLSATGQFSDGSSQDLTSTAVWTSSDSTIATVSTGGLTSALLEGTTNLAASYNGVTSGPVNLRVTPRPNLMFLGGGSASLFLEMGRAAQSFSANSTPCVWTQAKNPNILARDARFVPSIDEQGDIWIAWGPGKGTCAAPSGKFDVYSYMSFDSAIGNKCFFEVDASGTPGCVQIMSIPAGTAGANLLCSSSPSSCSSFGPDTPIPQALINGLSGHHFFVAGTEIRPEDAKFAVTRMFAPCDLLIPRQPFNQDSYYTFGLGYQTANPNLGTPVLGVDGFGGGSVNVVNFNITGNDPVTAAAVPTFSTYTVGAQPIIIAVSPASDSAGIGAASDINGFTLTLFYQGVLARTTNLFGPISPAKVVNVFVNDPLSGVYNAFEYSIPNSTQYHASQDYDNCGPGSLAWFNPLIYQSADAQLDAYRQRVIGNGNMTAALQGGTTSDNRMGYFFWSAANAAGLTNVKYLKVNGIDPIQDTYTNGVLPGGGAQGDPGIGTNITFHGVTSGDYPIWTTLRLVGPPAQVGIKNMLLALRSLDGTQHDYVSLINLKHWHSHYGIHGIGLDGQQSNGSTIDTVNDTCNPASGGMEEIGGDIGGAKVLRTANADFCADFNNPIGLVNKTQ